MLVQLLQPDLKHTPVVVLSNNDGCVLARSREAKAWPARGGVVDLTQPERQPKLMGLLPVNEVWGIGGKLTARLEQMGIKTALDLADADPQMIRKRFFIIVEKTVRELNVVSCLNLEEAAPTKQEIVCSRSFGERIEDFQAMREAISEYTSRGAEKLRGEKRLAKRLTVFIRTSPFNQQEPQYSNAATLEMVSPTDDSLSLVKAAHRGLENIWKNGFRFARGGILLSEFYDPILYQPDFWNEPADQIKTDKLIQTLDHINQS